MIIKNLIDWISQNYPLMLFIPFLILSIVYLRLTLLLLFSYPLCLFLIIFREALKILCGSMKDLEKNSTWEMVKLPQEKKTMR